MVYSYLFVWPEADLKFNTKTKYSKTIFILIHLLTSCHIESWSREIMIVSCDFYHTKCFCKRVTEPRDRHSWKIASFGVRTKEMIEIVFNNKWKQFCSHKALIVFPLSLFPLVFCVDFCCLSQMWFSGHLFVRVLQCETLCQSFV